MTKKELMLLTKEKLIIHAFNECGGMELEDEMLKADMVAEIMTYKPTSKPVPALFPEPVKKVASKSERAAFGVWFTEHLQKFTDADGLMQAHHPDMHGCIDAHPVCELCSPAMKSPKEEYAEL